MTLHFSKDELADRRKRALAAMKRQGLDGLLMFRQESMFYLTGYDTFGYVFFQCLVMNADGRLTLTTRAPDLRQARFTSIIEDIRVWKDGPEANPAWTDLKPILEEHGLKGKRLGIEWEAYGLTARNGRRVAAALENFCRLEDASELVTRLRVVKSPAEIAHVRRAAELGDEAINEAFRLAKPGAFEGDILAAMQGAIFRGGGNYPGNEFIISSGPAMLLTRYHADPRHLSPEDQLAVEIAGVYAHYHCGYFRTIKVGKRNKKHEEMHKVSADCLQACMDALKPGRPVGEVFDAYARAVEKGGYGAGRHNACGYSLGATFSPNWMDWPMFYSGNPVLAEPGMTFLINPGVRDDRDNQFAIVGETLLVTEKGSARLSKLPWDYVFKE